MSTVICPGATLHPQSTFSDINDHGQPNRGAMQYQPTTLLPPRTIQQPPEIQPAIIDADPQRMEIDDPPIQQPENITTTQPTVEEQRGKKRGGGKEKPSCVVCLRTFTAHRPPVCLPCNGAMSRHCTMCAHCLGQLITANPTKTHITCPLCRKPFDKQQVRQALRKGCLKFPANAKAFVHHYDKWDDAEEAMVPRKRQCLEHLHQGRVLRWDHITKNLPKLCAKMRQHISLSTKLNTEETNMLRMEVDFLSYAGNPSPEDYKNAWGLVYAFSPTMDPFPLNLEEVVSHVVSLFQHYREQPNGSNRFFSELDI